MSGTNVSMVNKVLNYSIYHRQVFDSAGTLDRKRSSSIYGKVSRFFLFASDNFDMNVLLNLYPKYK